jgi:hypothetical protein
MVIIKKSCETAILEMAISQLKLVGKMNIKRSSSSSLHDLMVQNPVVGHDSDQIDACGIVCQHLTSQYFVSIAAKSRIKEEIFLV